MLGQYVARSLKKTSKPDSSNSGYKKKILNDPEKFANFKAVYKIYLILHEKYHSIPRDVPKDVWHDKMISALTAQPILNLPKVKQILYSGLISRKAEQVVRKKGGLTKARKGTGKDAIANEHYYPRKHIVRKILEIKKPLNFDQFVESWWTQMGVYNITTKEENSKLGAYIKEGLQKKKSFDPLNWKKAYKECGIELIPDPRFRVTEEE
tara:strand:+ start:33 stop:659 length:627 start_codon:yes stop_codon:yes gene_type:complete